MENTDYGNVRAIFFDAVGTLLFPAVAVSETYRTAALRHGVDIAEAIIRDRFRQAFARQEEWDRLANWRTSEEREVERWQMIVRETFPEAGKPEGIFRDLWLLYRDPRAWRVRLDTAEVLNDLIARGFVLGMASNFDARLRAIVAGIPELAPLADRLVISSQAGWRKPSAEFYARVVAAAELPPEQILCIGDDRRNDFDGAIAAGMHAWLVQESDPMPHFNDIPPVQVC